MVWVIRPIRVGGVCLLSRWTPDFGWRFACCRPVVCRLEPGETSCRGSRRCFRPALPASSVRGQGGFSCRGGTFRWSRAPLWYRGRRRISREPVKSAPVSRPFRTRCRHSVRRPHVLPSRDRKIACSVEGSSASTDCIWIWVHQKKDYRNVRILIQD